jgi:hypothetical protein
VESTVKEAHKRNRNPKYKQKYRVTNWPEYDRSLRNRGDITLWFSEDAIQAWAPMHNGKQGRPKKLSDLTIETVLTLRLVFHLPLRQSEGSCVSKWYTREGSRVPHLLDGFDGDITSLTGDRGYNQRSVYRSVAKKNRGAATVIHPRSNAIVSNMDEWR